MKKIFAILAATTAMTAGGAAFAQTPPGPGPGGPGGNCNPATETCTTPPGPTVTGGNNTNTLTQTTTTTATATSGSTSTANGGAGGNGYGYGGEGGQGGIGNGGAASANNEGINISNISANAPGLTSAISQDGCTILHSRSLAVGVSGFGASGGWTKSERDAQCVETNIAREMLRSDNDQLVTMGVAATMTLYPESFGQSVPAAANAAGAAEARCGAGASNNLFNTFNTANFCLQPRDRATGPTVTVEVNNEVSTPAPQAAPVLATPYAAAPAAPVTSAPPTRSTRRATADTAAPPARNTPRTRGTGRTGGTGTSVTTEAPAVINGQRCTIRTTVTCPAPSR